MFIAILSIGERRLIKIVSAERGRNRTVVCAMNAIGTYVSLFLIIARLSMRPELLNGYPPGSTGVAQATGWMAAEGFLAYFLHAMSRPRSLTGR